MRSVDFPSSWTAVSMRTRAEACGLTLTRILRVLSCASATATPRLPLLYGVRRCQRSGTTTWWLELGPAARNGKSPHRVSLPNTPRPVSRDHSPEPWSRSRVMLESRTSSPGSSSMVEPATSPNVRYPERNMMRIKPPFGASWPLRQKLSPDQAQQLWTLPHALCLC
jgi:hypothetical protein